MKKQIVNTTQDSPAPDKSASIRESSLGNSATPVADSDALTQLRSENEQLKTMIRLSAAHRQITGELLKAGARSPELLFDSVKGDLQFADDGKVTNAASLIQKLKSGFPEQFGYTQPASIDGGARAGGGNTLTREALAKMKPAEIAELDWADVRRVLAGS